jgi:hypothetical protein
LHSDCPARVGLGQTLQRFRSKRRNALALANILAAVVQKLDQHVSAALGDDFSRHRRLLQAYWAYV